MWCCPSRGRPHNLARLIAAWKETGAAARLYLRLDDDDPRLNDYLGLECPSSWVRVVGPRTKAAGAMREVFSRWGAAEYYAFIGDDGVPRTDGWDRKLAGSAGDRFVSYPDDGKNGGKKATHPVCGGDLVREIGFWALPGLVHLYVDTVWDHIGRTRGVLRYCPDVLIEHMHKNLGKAPDDETYRQRSGVGKEIFEAWKAGFE